MTPPPSRVSSLSTVSLSYSDSLIRVASNESANNPKFTEDYSKMRLSSLSSLEQSVDNVDFDFALCHGWRSCCSYCC